MEIVQQENFQLPDNLGLIITTYIDSRWMWLKINCRFGITKEEKQVYWDKLMQFFFLYTGR